MGSIPVRWVSLSIKMKNSNTEIDSHRGKMIRRGRGRRKRKWIRDWSYGVISQTTAGTAESGRRWEELFLSGFRGNMALLAYWFWTSHLQNWETTAFSPLRKSGFFSLFHCHCQLLREGFPG